MAVPRLLDTLPSPSPMPHTRQAHQTCITDVELTLRTTPDGCSSPSEDGFIIFHATRNAEILVDTGATNENDARRIALPVALGLGICLVIALGIAVVYVRRQRAEALVGADEELLPRREEGGPVGESDASLEVEKEVERVERVDADAQVRPPASTTQPQADAQSVELVVRTSTGHG
ncbi:hypothetical protein FB45DRAFT_301962 [Roridomyces roridus]|uniref:Uncharacterized protein n=1 Tax=Roridomyces roridus TaxID=1738132 RepID=A0AAD7B812_9AGAR|nr:hypothetical protein FB45DRAFT_301962 [Roridomyces roridus]